MCRRLLTTGALLGQTGVVLGEECHIISKKERGPRSYLSETTQASDLDGPDNLILLCPDDHKIVDAHPDLYTADTLRAIKSTHEIWVTQQLNPKEPDQPLVVHLPRLRTGREVFSLLERSKALLFEYSDPPGDIEAQAAARLRQALGDWLDVLDMVEAGDKVRHAYEFNQTIIELVAHGYYLFGAVHNYAVDASSADKFRMPTACFMLLAEGSPGVISSEEGGPLGVIAGLPKRTHFGI